MTSPKPSPKPQSARETLLAIQSELKRYSELVEVDDKKRHSESKELDGEISSKRKQLERAITDIKDATSRLTSERAEQLFEMEKKYKIRAKELERDIRLKEATLDQLNTDTARLEQTLASCKTNLDTANRKHTDMLEAIKEQESVYEELAAKVNEQRDLHTDYMRLIHEQRQLNEDYARDLNTRKLEHDEAVSKINQQMTDFKSAIAAEKETLSAQVKEEYERLQVIKGDIKNAITADSERVKTLAGDEEALSIRIRAFKKREEEFETEKRRFASSSRL